jgi:hypothetical protein
VDDGEGGGGGGDGVDFAVVTGLVVGGEAIDEGGRSLVTNRYSTTLSQNKQQ